MANLNLFLTILKTAAKQNNHPIPPHLAVLTESHALTETDDLNTALQQAGESFDAAQCGCLLLTYLTRISKTAACKTVI